MNVAGDGVCLRHRWCSCRGGRPVPVGSRGWGRCGRGGVVAATAGSCAVCLAGLVARLPINAATAGLQIADLPFARPLDYGNDPPPDWTNLLASRT